MPFGTGKDRKEEQGDLVSGDGGIKEERREAAMSDAMRGIILDQSGESDAGRW